MAEQDRTTLDGYFNAGDIPSEGQFQDLIDSYVNSREDGRAGETVDSMAGLLTVNTSSLKDGATVIVQNFYSDTEGGGDPFYWDIDGDKADHNGITIIDPTHSTTPGQPGWWTSENTGTTGVFRRREKGILSVMDAGAKPSDNSKDDSEAIQSAIDYAYTKRISYQPDGSGSFIETEQKVFFPNGRYKVLNTINGKQSVELVTDDRVIFEGDPNNLITCFDFTDEAWRTTFEGLSFVNFDTCVLITTGNLNVSMVEFKRCLAYNCNTFIDTGSYANFRSTNLTLEYCVATDSTDVFLKTYADVTKIKDCWVYHSGYNGPSIISDSKLLIDSCMLIPAAGTPTGSKCWVKAEASDFQRGVTFLNTRVSGESGSTTAVRNHMAANASMSSNKNQTYISFIDSTVNCSGQDAGDKSIVIFEGDGASNALIPNIISFKKTSITGADDGIISAPSGLTIPNRTGGGGWVVRTFNIDNYSLQSARLDADGQEKSGSETITSSNLSDYDITYRPKTEANLPSSAEKGLLQYNLDDELPTFYNGSNFINLANFETGAWSPNPTISSNWDSLGSVTNAKYAQIGDVVYYRFVIQSVNPTATGRAELSFTLPINQGTGTDPCHGLVTRTGYTEEQGHIDYASGGNTTSAFANINITNVDATRDLNISGYYII